MKISALAFFILSFVFSNIANSGGLNQNSLSIIIYDPITKLEKKVFNPGEAVGYTVTATAPIGADFKKATVTTQGKIKIKQLSIPLSLSQKISAPIANVDASTGVVTVSGAGTTHAPYLSEGIFTIPEYASGAEVTMSVKVSIASFGAVTQKVTIKVN